MMVKKNNVVPKWVSENLPPELADSTLFKFKVSLPNGIQVEVDMLPDIDTDYDILQEQLQDIPAQYTYWAAMYSEMKSLVSVAERKVKARKGECIEEVLKSYREEGVKPPSVEQVKSIVEKDRELQKLDIRYALVQKHVGKMWHMVEALKLKAEVLRSLAGFKRQELTES
jgi:hypothetical protein